eukprot:CAMPEP_0179067344 /NCGR_PEP_ID=MMETSP0796-20121207/29440_1 /TAXON_ID=73915 /ORGANISM="Pyrodinium bahamense, Strain pbaha01" /LENGTH=156 /DNA_ID=CAMNT_0020764369 /DNA_START=537 /DNA_END=1005 /DNA_ORIENTATION=+
MALVHGLTDPDSSHRPLTVHAPRIHLLRARLDIAGHNVVNDPLRLVVKEPLLSGGAAVDWHHEAHLRLPLPLGAGSAFWMVRDHPPVLDVVDVDLIARFVLFAAAAPLPPGHSVLGPVQYAGNVHQSGACCCSGVKPDAFSMAQGPARRRLECTLE